MGRIENAIVDLINSVSGDAMVGVFGTILGTFMGWILNSISQSGKIFISDMTLEFQQGSGQDVYYSNTMVEKKGEVYGCDIAFSIVSTSGQEKLLRNISFYAGLKRIKTLNVSEEYEQDYNKYFKNTQANTIKLTPKEYKRFGIFINADDLKKIKPGTKRITIFYGDGYIKKPIKLGRWDLRGLYNNYCKENT